MPRGVYFSALRGGGLRSDQGKTLAGIPAFMLKSYEKNKQPGLKAGLAGDWLANMLTKCIPPLTTAHMPEGRIRDWNLEPRGRLKLCLRLIYVWSLVGFFLFFLGCVCVCVLQLACCYATSYRSRRIAPGDPCSASSSAAAVAISKP